MPDSLPNILAKCASKGYVIAPAGYGKTHLIALAVKAASHRQLILTHTFAGVNSVKSKMTVLGVPSSRYQVDTIASWSLRLCLAYPKTSGWKVENPTSKEEWNKLCESCRGLLGKEFIRHVISSTYSGVYVDEYQDCSDFQHTLVCALADFLPCRILGDPMQAIFDFANKPVDWDASIYPHFERLGKLDTPWRWHNAGAYELGAWLKAVRETLEAGQKVNLNVALPKGVKRVSVNPQFLSAKQRSLLCDFLGDDSTVIALHGGDQQSKNKTHLLARSMAGKFSSIEEVEGKDLFSFIKKLQSTKTVKEGFLLALKFAKKCFTGVDKTLTTGTKKGEVTKQIKTTKYPLVLASANRYLNEPISSNLREFFYAVKDNPETSTYRRDLFNRLMNIMKIHIDGEAATLLESANNYQRELRHTGRPLRHKKLIGTTLLVKGLEYDHAILLDADSLRLKELYVAMTRGSKSLTIITNSNSIPTS